MNKPMIEKLSPSLPPQPHVWFQPSREQAGYPWTICLVCGVVQRRDKLNKPCKGPTKLREMEQYVDD